MRKSFRWIMSLVLAVILMGAAPVTAAPFVFLDGKQLSFDVPPVIENDRTLVPMAAIFTALGAQVSWNEATNTVTAVKDDTTIILKLGNNIVTKNGQAIVLDVPPKTINDRTMVPLAFVGTAFGGTVEWNPDNEFITITSPSPSPKPLVPAPLGSLSNPIPKQTRYLTPQGIEITVKAEIEENAAWNVISEANMFNEEPSTNMKYVIITYTIKNVSSAEESKHISSYDFALTGSSKRVFTQFDKLVVLPSEGQLKSFNETLYHGGSATGSSVFHVPSSETHLVLIWNYLSPDGKVYFEVPWYLKG